VRRHFPQLKVVARARDRFHAHRMIDAGAGTVVRETYHSSLRMAEEALKGLGHPGERARREVGIFRDYDERLLMQQHAFQDDEDQLIQSTRNAAEELAGLLEADRREVDEAAQAAAAAKAARRRGRRAGGGPAVRR
ncbi:MAG TPA: hypothetical protein VG939_07675, partial [Caulobacteraceae bacterium]|nr:hypothetical protein [Caulobacteraceae bacterium]